jgi:hypothetical protein
MFWIIPRDGGGAEAGDLEPQTLDANGHGAACAQVGAHAWGSERRGGGRETLRRMGGGGRRGIWRRRGFERRGRCRRRRRGCSRGRPGVRVAEGGQDFELFGAVDGEAFGVRGGGSRGGTEEGEVRGGQLGAAAYAFDFMAPCDQPNEPLLSK